MKVRILLFLLATCIGVLGQTKTLNQFPELPEAPNAADWVYQWDVSEAKSVKVRVDNFFKALPIAGLTTIGGVKRNVGGAGEFVSGVDASGNLVYGVPAGGGGISITGYRVPYGNGSGSLTSEGGFEYDALANKLSVVNASVSEVRFGTNNISIGSPTPGSLYISEGTLTGDELVFDLTSDNAARLYSGTLVSTFQFDGIDVIVPTEVYDSGTWNGSNEVPTKDAVRDKIEAVILGGPALTTTLVGYGSGTGALTGEAGFEYNPSTNTFKVDKILSRSELQIAGAGGTPDNVGIYSPAAGSIGFFEGTLTGDDLIFDLSVDNAARVYSLAGVVSLEFDGISLVGYGTTKSGTQAAPTTTNPFSPTWTTQDYVLWYGATGQVNLPAVATYTNKTIRIYSTGTFTITVDPNGSEIIVESGVSLGAGVSDTIVGEAGLWTSYTCDGSRWVKQESGGAGTFTGTGTYAANFIYSGTMSADATLTLSPFVAGSTVEFDLDVTGATRTATFPSSLRAGYSSAAITTLALPVGRQRLSFYNNGTSIILLDSVPDDVILATDTSGAFVKSIEDSGSSEILVTGSGSEDAEVTLELSAGIARVSGNIGAATATTPAAADDSTKVATTAWVQDELAGQMPLTEEFYGPSTAASFGIFGMLREGLNGGSTTLTPATTTDTARGQYNLYTSTATNGRIGVMATASPTQILFGGESIALKARIFIESLAATTTNELVLRHGFLDSLSGEPVDGAYFRYSHANANWICVTRSNDSETTHTTSVAVVEDAWIKHHIKVNAAGTEVEFYINGSLVHTATGTIPTGASRYTSFGTSCIKSAGSVDNDLFLDYFQIIPDPTSTRF